MNKMKKTKKIKISFVLKTIVVLIALSSMLLNSILGVTKSEYFKSLSKKLDLEVNPDLKFEYLVYDAQATKDDTKTTNVDEAAYTLETGVYESVTNFVQPITISDKDKVTIGNKTVEYGGGVAYKIKIPVDETGYYSLNFTTYTLAGLSGNEDDEFYTVQYVYAFGCEVVGVRDSEENYGGTTKFDKEPFEIAFRTFSRNGGGRTSFADEPFLYADSAVLGEGNADTVKDSVYQWKSLCPFRAENVKLAYKVEQADVDRGYVIWAWDVRGLQGAHNYRIFVENLSIEKTMELNGTNKNRTYEDPYFMFPQTAYINNNVDTGGTSGKNRFSNGRGTYVTEATANSLGMRAEMLYKDTTHSNTTSIDNPLGIYIPLKNIKFDKTYKVTFDFSIAKQGSAGPDANKLNGYDNKDNPQADWHNYQTVNLIFNRKEGDVSKLPIQSYLHSGLTAANTQADHNTLKSQINYANKQYQDVALTKYDEVNSFGSFDLGISTNVNDTFSKSMTAGNENTINRNFFNAIEHIEYNGQNKIHWLTFYNTTFSFNIPESQNGSIDINDLYWIWEIDATKYTAFYNIRIDNVRIQEVVDYSSALESNGFRIGTADINPRVHLEHAGQGRTQHTGTDAEGYDLNAFANFKARNSTGQNYQARMHDESKYMVRGNIYAPIVDAKLFQAKAATNPYKIFLKGWAVVDGGIDKYVYSIDGGITWYDMVFNGDSDTTDGDDPDGILDDAEYGINQHVQGQTTVSGGTDWIDFDANDATNCRFDDFTLSADLKDYATQANLDIIIAAVPAENINLRCEILRIINFNQIRNYMTFPFDIVSDITVMSPSVRNGDPAATQKTAESLLNVNRIDETNIASRGHYNNLRVDPESMGFTFARSWLLSTNTPSTTTGYARMASYSYAYEDIRTLYYDFPVKRTLGLTGWAIVEGGVEAYYWSTDYGKTWELCTSMNQTTKVGTEPAKPLERTLISPDYKTYYYDGVAFNANKTEDLALKKNHCFRDSINGKFDGTTPTVAPSDGIKNSGKMLTANLSDYIGKVVDVIFAAKPNGSDVYVPVGRIDNVSVWGTGEKGQGMGPFYSFTGDFYYEDKDNIERKFTTVYGSSVRVDHLGNSLNNFDQWGMKFPESVGVSGANGASHSSYEPYNVNPTQMRKFYDGEITVRNGAKFKISGFMMCHGGVAKYKLSLDGGETFVDLQCVGGDNPDTDSRQRDFLYSRRVDATFDAGDVENSTYMEIYGGQWLEFYLPVQTPGARRELLVVAEGANGYDYPVLRLSLRIAGDTPALVYYQQGGTIIRDNWPDAHKNDPSNVIKKGYNALLEEAPKYTAAQIEGEKTHLNTISAGDVYTASTSNRYRLTVPVEEVGLHSLRFYLSVVDKVSHPPQDNTDYTGSRYTGNITISSYLLHDSGETYYNNMNKQITASNKQDFANRIDEGGSLTFTNSYYQLAGYSSGPYHLYINVTEEDVGRGYVVWDFDITEFSKATG